MALDFSKLPPEKPVPETPPSRFVWTVVFFVLTLLGIFAVLMLWPADEPTRTPLFWICVTVVPIGIAMLAVLRRYSVYEGRRLDALEWNEACKRYNAEEFSRESIPVLVLGSALQVTGDDKADAVGQIADGTLTLDAQASDHEENESVSARWIEPLEARLAADDVERHALVLEWLYDCLQTDLTRPVSTLPMELGLNIRLEVSGYRGEVDALTLWNDRWRAHKLRSARAFPASDTPGPMVLDSWLDDQGGPLDKGALLLVSISLNALLEGVPPEGSAEAGTGLLMVSTRIASRHGLHPIAAIHRPVRSANDNLDHPMTSALRWGSAGVQSLGSAWMTGFDGETVGPLHTALGHVSADTPRKDTLPEFDLDRAVGNAGPAAGWLAVACAVQTASQAPAPQLVTQRCADHTVIAVVRKHDEEMNHVSSPA
ncbi:hypothetical protein VSR34_06330 [Paraburkholderia sp. JHI2823]|uniref:hypothetical protein n=1 Tax=Paraburkholderia TaxID=1822464 RepID=UPI0003FCB3C6|nr:hypothetical protein [Paraburkholderia mimosarum]